MPVIGRVSNGSSSSRAISYAFGKNRHMKNNTEQWLANHGVKVEFPYIGYSENSRAVWVGGSNGIDGYHASDDMAFNQRIHNQTEQKNQVKRIVQSFSHNEADPLNPADWEKANKLGVEFAKKAYPNYQCAVFTQIDNENHLIHNHIIVDKVNLKTGYKLKEPRRIDDYRKINDEIAKKYGMEVIPPKRERTLNAENQKKKPGRKAFVSYVKETVDRLMMSDEITSKADFIKALDQKDIIYTDENKMNRFVSKTVKNKSGKPLVVRGKTLGTDYEKGAINHELDVRERDSKTEEREPRIERTIDRTSEIERNYNESKNDYLESERNNTDAQTRKQQAEADDQQAQSQQSKINAIFANLEQQAKKFRNRFGRFELKIKRFFKQNQDTNSNADKQDKNSNVDKQDKNSSADKQQNTNSNVDKQAQNHPTKPIELDKYGLNRDQRLMIDAGNKIIRERGHELGELQLGYDGLTLREREAEKNHEVAKRLKLTKGQIDTLVDANEEYSRTGLPRYKVFPHGLSYNYNLKFKKFQKQQKLAENQAVREQQQSKEQTPTRRTSRRLEIKKNQTQKKNIDRGPKM